MEEILSHVITLVVGSGIGAGLFKWLIERTKSKASHDTQVELAKMNQASDVFEYVTKRVTELEGIIRLLVKEKNEWQEKFNQAQAKVFELKSDLDKILFRYEYLKNCPKPDCPVKTKIGG